MRHAELLLLVKCRSQMLQTHSSLQLMASHSWHAAAVCSSSLTGCAYSRPDDVQVHSPLLQMQVAQQASCLAGSPDAGIDSPSPCRSGCIVSQAWQAEQRAHQTISRSTTSTSHCCSCSTPSTCSGSIQPRCRSLGPSVFAEQPAQAPHQTMSRSTTSTSRCCSCSVPTRAPASFKPNAETWGHLCLQVHLYRGLTRQCPGPQQARPAAAPAARPARAPAWSSPGAGTWGPSPVAAHSPSRHPQPLAAWCPLRLPPHP